MIKGLSFFLLLFISIEAFSQTSFNIYGKIETEGPLEIEISYLDKTDTIFSSNGEFRITGTVDHPTLFFFYVRNSHSRKTTSKYLFLEEGEAIINSKFDDFKWTVPVLFPNVLQEKMDAYNNKFSHLTGMFRFSMDSLRNSKDADSDDKRKANTLIEKILDFEKLYERDFILQNTNNYLGAYFFYRYGIQFMDQKEADSVYNLFPDYLQNSFYLKKAGEKLKYAKLLKEGEPVISVKIKDTKLKDVDFKTLFVNKLTLVDLWATWCIPCIESHVLLKELYAKYKNAGLSIIGISLDDNKENWLKFLAKKTLPWPNYIDIQGETGEINKIFNIAGGSGIPYFIFVDEKGKYLKIGLETEQLEAFIINYLK